MTNYISQLRLTVHGHHAIKKSSTRVVDFRKTDLRPLLKVGNYPGLLRLLIFCWALLGAPLPLPAQSFTSFPAGDDATTSLGQFQIVLDQAWVKTFDIIMTNSPLGNTFSTRHLRLYHHGVFTSPTLYDPATTIGRSDSFLSGAPQETLGALAGRAPGRTFIKDSQLTVRPDWAETNNGVHEIHTFIKSMHLTDLFTTRVGFSVKAGMEAPTRPVSAGQVEASNPTSDFPAKSFFNVYVQVDLPGGGVLPAIQLVNVDPLLVQQTNVFSFPPRIIYQHENSTAVSMYFNTDVVIPDPQGGTDIHVTRGTLFGQLTLAGHGVGFAQAETEAFQAEIEAESATASMPVNPLPVTSVQIEDFSPDYNAFPPTVMASHFTGDGSFVFSVSHVAPNTTNYVQVSTNVASGNWQTVATIVSTTNSFIFIDPGVRTNQQRFYRWTAVP